MYLLFMLYMILYVRMVFIVVLFNIFRRDRVFFVDNINEDNDCFFLVLYFGDYCSVYSEFSGVFYIIVIG